MNDKELISVIDHLAEKLGTTAGQLIDLYAQQIQIHWYAGLAVSVAAVIFFAVLCYALTKKAESVEEKGGDSDDVAAFQVVAFFCLLFAILSVAALGAHLINLDEVLLPKAAATQQLIKSLR